jgi:hypothetical protein
MVQLGLSATVAGQSIDGAMRRSSGSITEARAAARLLEESFGITLPRELTTFMAKSASIGPMLTAAFDIAVPIGFAAALIPIGKELYDWATDAKGAAEQTKALNELAAQTSAEIQKQTDLYEKYKDEIDKLEMTEQAYALSRATRAANAAKYAQDALDQAIKDRDNMVALSQQKNPVAEGLDPAMAAFTDAAKEAQTHIAAMNADITVQQAEVKALNEAWQLAATQIDEAQGKEAQKNADALTKLLQKQHDQMMVNLADQAIVAIEAEKRYEEQFGAFTTFLTKGMETEQATVDKMISDMAAKPIPLPGFSTSDPTAERAGKAIVAANDAIAKDYESTYKQIDNSVNRTFDSMERGIADSIVHWKGFGDTIKSIFDDLATSAIRSLEKILFGGIEKDLTGLLSKFAGNLFGVAPLAGVMGLGSAALGAGGVATGSAAGAWGLSSVTPLGAGAAGAGGAGLAGAGLLLGLEALASAGIAAAVGIAVYLGIQFATGPSAWQAADKEIERDLGLSGLGTAFANWCASKHITEAQAWPWRKELYTSPSFIAEVAVPYAQQKGSLGTLLGNLSCITTSWGTFNLQAEATIGVTTGSWTAYNRAWNSTIGRGAAFGTLGVALDEGGMQSVNIAAPTIAAPTAAGAGAAGIGYSSASFHKAVLSVIRDSYNAGGLDYLVP